MLYLHILIFQACLLFLTYIFGDFEKFSSLQRCFKMLELILLAHTCWIVGQAIDHFINMVEMAGWKIICSSEIITVWQDWVLSRLYSISSVFIWDSNLVNYFQTLQLKHFKLETSNCELHVTNFKLHWIYKLVSLWIISLFFKLHLLVSTS